MQCNACKRVSVGKEVGRTTPLHIPLQSSHSRRMQVISCARLRVVLSLIDCSRSKGLDCGMICIAVRKRSPEYIKLSKDGSNFRHTAFSVS